MNATGILSRDQLKTILGGSDPIADGIHKMLGDMCDNTLCQLVIEGSDGSQVTRSGYCSWGSIYPHCYCETGLVEVHLTSNGGTSRCNR